MGKNVIVLKNSGDRKDRGNTVSQEALCEGYRNLALGNEELPLCIMEKQVKKRSVFMRKLDVLAGLVGRK